MTVYSWLWLSWGVYFAVVEGWALWASWRDRAPASGTLSHHVWRWMATAPGSGTSWWAWVRRAALVGFLLWLAVHLVGGGRVW